MSKRHVLPIETQRIRLRLLQERDLPLTLAWRNQEHIRKWFFHCDLIAPDQHRAWFEQYRERDDDFVFLIEEVQRQYRPVGQLALYNIDFDGKRAEFGRLMIGEPDARGKGLAREATVALLGAVLKTFGLDEVYLEVLADNDAAIKVYTACGFGVTCGDGSTVRMSRSISLPQGEGTGEMSVIRR